LKTMAKKGPAKKRSWYLTAWLLVVAAANTAIWLVWGLDFLIHPEVIGNCLANSAALPSCSVLWLVTLAAVLNTLFAYALFKWKLLGFYGMAAVCLLVVLMNLATGSGNILLWLVQPIVLYLAMRPQWKEFKQ